MIARREWGKLNEMVRVKKAAKITVQPNWPSVKWLVRIERETVPGKKVNLNPAKNFPTVNKAMRVNGREIVLSKKVNFNPAKNFSTMIKVIPTG